MKIPGVVVLAAAAQGGGKCRVAIFIRELEVSLGLTAQLDVLGIRNVDAAAVQPDVGADLPGQHGVLFGGVATDQQNGRSRLEIAQGSGRRFVLRRRLGKRGIVRGAVMVNIVGADHHPRKLLQQIVLFVGGAVGADDAERFAATLLANLFEAFADVLDCVFPADGLELTILLPDQGLGEAVGAVYEIESEAALDAEEVAVDPALVAIVGAHNRHAFIGTADAEGGLATVAAVGADGGDMVHFPGPRLIAIGAGGQRAHGTDVNAGAALLAIQMVFAVGRDH